MDQITTLGRFLSRSTHRCVLSTVASVNAKEDGNLPYVMCEYCHAMGNGPGDLEDYFQVFHQHSQICGGFVWEWCDHAVYAGKDEKGREKYLYGGDFKEASRMDSSQAGSSAIFSFHF